MGGTFDLNLPAIPRGTLNDVDNNGEEDLGVQIFAVAYSPNLYGGPFSQGDDRSRGWPSYLASVKTDSENNDEVVGGRLVIWSPDTDQQFPAGFGDDGLLFTLNRPGRPYFSRIFGGRSRSITFCVFAGTNTRICFV